MVYNTEQQIRDGCGMSATLPTSAVIARWQALTDAMIEAFQPAPTELIAARIELNRCKVLYASLKKSGDKGPQDISSAQIAPLSPTEKTELDPSAVDSVPMNGQRYSTWRR